MTQVSSSNVHRVVSGAEAVEIARSLAADLAVEAGERDRERRLPSAEVARLAASGLLGITVPRRFGGPELDIAVVTEVFRLLATADASISQVPQSHFVFLEVVRLQGDERQQALFFGEALDGRLFANAQTERTSRTVAEDATTLTSAPGGGYVLDGTKYYATGSLFADWLAVRAGLPHLPPLANGLAPRAIAYLRRDTPGVTVEDDWDGMGQRTTASGTVRLDQVPVPAEHVVAFSPIFDGPSTYGARAQVLHAAIDAGIARGALQAAVELAGKARPWFESGVERAVDDPLLIQQAGEAEVTVRGAEALLREAAAAISRAEADLDGGTTAAASIATAAAKVAAARAAVEIGDVLFELGGTRATAAALNASRHWRDARTHSVHDPTRWKVQHIGRWVLTDTAPPRHGLL
jgi:SfnB family sulfur acquisition oxidoreductase